MTSVLTKHYGFKEHCFGASFFDVSSTYVRAVLNEIAFRVFAISTVSCTFSFYYAAFDILSPVMFRSYLCSFPFNVSDLAYIPTLMTRITHCKVLQKV